MIRTITIILLASFFIQTTDAKNIPKDFVVGNFGMHFDKLGDVIKPDEYYFFNAMENAKEGYKKSALKNFRKAASYGNTFGAYYSGLLYLQNKDQIKGYAWLTMADTKNFIFSDKIQNLLFKLKHQMSQEDLIKATAFHEALEEHYGVEATFQRRLKWSRNFRMTGSNIKGNLPNFTQVRTDLSNPVTGKIQFGDTARSNSFIDVLSMKRQFSTFVYDYKSDFRLTDGEVNMGDLDIIEVDKQK